MDKYCPPTLTVFICFAIEKQEFVVVVFQEASSSTTSLHIHDGKYLQDQTLLKVQFLSKRVDFGKALLKSVKFNPP